MIEEADARAEKYGNISPKKFYRDKVLNEGMTIAEVKADNLEAYNEDWVFLKSVEMSILQIRHQCRISE